MRPKTRFFDNFPFATQKRERLGAYRSLISVVLPVYNQAKFVAESVGSVLGQVGYPVELIIVDDGSTDNLDTVLKPFVADSRVRILRQENRGVAAALNAGFECVRGSLLTWTSADNCYLPGALNQLADFLLANPTVGMAYANVELIDDNGNPCRGSNYRVPDQDEKNSNQLLLPLHAETLGEFHDNFINACFLYRREVRDAVGPYRDGLVGYEDFDYWLRTSDIFRIAHVDDDAMYYRYRLHDDSLTGKLAANTLERNVKQLIANRKAKRALFPSVPLVSLQSHPQVAEDIRQSLAEILTEAGCPICPAIEHRELFRPAVRLALETGERHPPEAFAFRPADHDTSSIFFVTKSLAADISRLIPGIIVLPPLTPPAILRRARDNNFQAVKPDKNSLVTVLIFAPDEASDSSGAVSWAMARIQTLVENLPRVTFVLFCANSKQRLAAEDLDRQYGQKGRIRIIEAEENRPDLSLLYTLSSIDVVLSIKAKTLTLSSLLELRSEAALAAMAGRNVLAVMAEPCVESEYCLSDATVGAEACPDPAALLSSSVMAIPNVSILIRDEYSADLFVEFQNILTSLAPTDSVDLRSLEQWLDSVHPRVIGKKILDLISSDGEYTFST